MNRLRVVTKKSKGKRTKFLVQSVTVEIKIIAAYKIKESLLESGPPVTVHCIRSKMAIARLSLPTLKR
jgi:hypothetical protein